MTSRLVILCDNDLSADSRVNKQIATAALAQIPTTVIGISSEPMDPRTSGSVMTIWAYDTKPSPTPERLLDVAEILTGTLPTEVPAPEDVRTLAFEANRAVEFIDITHPKIFRMHAAVAPALEAIDWGEDDIALHVNDYPLLPVAVDFARRRTAQGRRTTLIYDAHEWVVGYTELGPEAHSIATQLEAEGISGCQEVVTVSERIAGFLSDQYALTQPVHVVCNTPEFPGSPVTGPSLRERFHVSEDDFLVIYSGSQGYGRELDICIDAISDIPGVVLGLVVSSSATPRMRDLLRHAEARGVRDRVRVARMVPSEEIVDYLSGADAGLIPFTPGGNRDIAVPTKAAEYAVAGVPLVVSDRPALKDHVITHGIGTVYETGHASSLARAIRDVQQNREQYQRNLESVARSSAWATDRVQLITAWSRALGRHIPAIVDPPAPTPIVNRASGRVVIGPVARGTGATHLASLIPNSQIVHSPLSHIDSDISSLVFWNGKNLLSDNIDSITDDVVAAERAGVRCLLHLNGPEVLTKDDRLSRILEHLGLPTLSPSRGAAQLAWITWLPPFVDPMYFEPLHTEDIRFRSTVVDARPQSTQTDAAALAEACLARGLEVVDFNALPAADRPIALRTAHLVIDRLAPAGFSERGARAMAAGRPIITWLPEADRPEHTGQPSYALHATPETITEVIRNVTDLPETAQAAAQFAGAYLSGECAAAVVRTLFPLGG